LDSCGVEWTILAAAIQPHNYPATPHVTIIGYLFRDGRSINFGFEDEHADDTPGNENHGYCVQDVLAKMMVMRAYCPPDSHGEGDDAEGNEYIIDDVILHE
jgi:hypothetical protein